MGGLARRATVFHKWQKEENAFAVAGAYELSRPEEKASHTALSAFRPAFTALNYDFGALNKSDVEQLNAAHQRVDQAMLPPEWMPFSSQPQTVIFTHEGIRLGFILFPEGEPHALSSSNQDAEFAKLSKTIEALDASCDLTIGMSPWGWSQEKKFLDSMTYGPSLLLGSGPGPAVQGKLANNGRTLWLRPYSRGRAIQAITIFNPQDKAWEKQWRIEDNVHVEFLVLDDRIVSNAHMEDLLRTESR